MKRLVSWLRLLAVALVLGACDGDGAIPDTTERTDSAGIEIIVNRVGPEELPLRSLSPEPTVRIESDEEGGPVLFEIRSLALLERGGLAVASHGTKRVLVFDSESNLVAELGREGDGPGEFNAVESVVAVADSLFVHDPSLRRITVFAQDGGLGRTLDVTELVPRGFSALLPSDDGLVVFGQGGFGGRRELGTFRNPAPSARIGRDGAALASYGEFPGVELVVGENVLGVLPFGARLFGATYSDVLVVGTAEGPQIEYYDGMAELVRIVRWPDHARDVTRERYEAFIGAQLADVPENERSAARGMFEKLQFAERAPPYQDLIATDRGEIWVGDYPGPEALGPNATRIARTWLVIAPDGRLSERIRTPAGFHPFVVRDDAVYGAFTDEFGVESIRVYELGS